MSTSPLVEDLQLLPSKQLKCGGFEGNVNMVRTNEERALDAFSIENIDDVLPKDHLMNKEYDLRWIGNVRIDVRTVIECQSNSIRNSTRGDHTTGLSFRGV